MRFPFNQPDKTRDCGYRCLYYALNLRERYENWVDQFRFFNPVTTGIHFADICQVLNFYEREYVFTQLSEVGLYIIYSGIWLHPEGKKHGHYFVYHDGVVYCSTHSQPYRMPLKEVLKRLEAKTVDHAFRVLQVKV